MRSDLAPCGASPMADSKILNDHLTKKNERKLTIATMLFFIVWKLIVVLSRGAIEGNFLVRCVKGPQ